MSGRNTLVSRGHFPVVGALALSTALALAPAHAQRAATPIISASPQSAGVSAQRLERLTAAFKKRWGNSDAVRSAALRGIELLGKRSGHDKEPHRTS